MQDQQDSWWKSANNSWKILVKQEWFIKKRTRTGLKLELYSVIVILLLVHIFALFIWCTCWANERRKLILSLTLLASLLFSNGKIQFQYLNLHDCTHNYSFYFQPLSVIPTSLLFSKPGSSWKSKPSQTTSRSFNACHNLLRRFASQSLLDHKN